jgi:hypothetical protein
LPLCLVHCKAPTHVVAEWLGNSPKTALAHYTQVTEEHYQKALQNPVQQGADVARTEPQVEHKEKPDGEEMRELTTYCMSLQDNPMTPTGFEPVSRP